MNQVLKFHVHVSDFRFAPATWGGSLGGSCLAFPEFSSLRTHFRTAYCNRLRVDSRFSLLKYCSRSEPSLNCRCPTLSFGEVFDLSLSFCLRHLAARPAAFQIIRKNDAKSSLFDLLRDVFGKNFQSTRLFVWFLTFISFRCLRFYQVLILWHASFIRRDGACQPTMKPQRTKLLFPGRMSGYKDKM